MNIFWSQEEEDLKALCQSLMRENSELKWELKTVAKKDHRHDRAAESVDLFDARSGPGPAPLHDTPDGEGSNGAPFDSAVPPASAAATPPSPAAAPPSPRVPANGNLPLLPLSDPPPDPPRFPPFDPVPETTLPNFDPLFLHSTPTPAAVPEAPHPPASDPPIPVPGAAPVTPAGAAEPPPPAASCPAVPTPEAVPVPSNTAEQEEVVALRERVRQLEAANGTLLKDLSRSQELLTAAATKGATLERLVRDLEVRVVGLTVELERERLRHQPWQPKQKQKTPTTGEIPVWLVP
jgi:hypothetical protein